MPLYGPLSCGRAKNSLIPLYLRSVLRRAAPALTSWIFLGLSVSSGSFLRRSLMPFLPLKLMRTFPNSSASQYQ